MGARALTDSRAHARCGAQALSARELEGAPLLLLVNKTDLVGAPRPRKETPRAR